MSRYNVYNQTDISDYLNKIANRTDEGNTKLAEHLQIALSKPLEKDERWLQQVTEMPSGAPTWLTEKQLAGGEIHKFIPDEDLDRKDSIS